MKKRKLISLVLACCIITSYMGTVSAFAAETTSIDNYSIIACGTNEEPVAPMSDAAANRIGEFDIVACGTTEEPAPESVLVLPSQEPRWEDSVVNSRVAAINVDVQSPLEKSWRDTYSNYYYEANCIVEKIDDYLSDEFGIDFYSVAQPHWTTTKTTGRDVIEDAMYNIGKGNADIMIAFIGPVADGYTTEGYKYLFGIATVEQPYAVVFDHGYKQNCKSGQHEVGHTYGLCPDPKVHCTKTCVMHSGWDNGTEWKYFNHLCPDHWSQWDDAKGWY